MQFSEKQTEFDPWAWEYRQPDETPVFNVPASIARIMWGRLFSPRREERDQAVAFWRGVFMGQAGDAVREAGDLLEVAKFIARSL